MLLKDPFLNEWAVGGVVWRSHEESERPTASQNELLVKLDFQLAVMLKRDLLLPLSWFTLSNFPF